MQVKAAHALWRVPRGAHCPLVDGAAGESEVSLARDETAKRLPQPERFDTGLADTIPWCVDSQRIDKLRDSEGVSTGDGKSPSKVGVVLPRTPCVPS